MTPEAKVKKRVKEVLEGMYVAGIKIYYFMPPANGYGRAGIPDFVGIIDGRFFAIETKAGKGKTTALQDRELCRIREAGGIALVVNEENLDSIRAYLMR